MVNVRVAGWVCVTKCTRSAGKQTVFMQCFRDAQKRQNGVIGLDLKMGANSNATKFQLTMSLTLLNAQSEYLLFRDLPINGQC